MTQISHIALGIIISNILNRIWLWRFIKLTEEESVEAIDLINRFFK